MTVARSLSALALALCLAACKTTYRPTEYPLRDGLIPPIATTGDVRITNDQPSTDPLVVYSFGGSEMRSDLHAITETMVQQATRELAKNTRGARPGAAKRMLLKVTALYSDYGFYSFHSTIQFEVKLGDADPLRQTVHHGSFDVTQDLNGCIAEGVMVLFKDESVRAYLER